MYRKPILLDALYINAGGGLNLLEYLVEVLVNRNIDVCLLKDSRCKVLAFEDRLSEVIVLKASLHNRYKFYCKHKDDYRGVLCFANIPCPIKMPCPVYTYFHNANLLQIPKEFSLCRKLLNWFKQTIIKILSGNTDRWIVQTDHMSYLLRKVFHVRNEIYLLPFYRMPIQNHESANRTDYILVGNYTGTRGHDELLMTWEKLLAKGMTPTLHLTVDDEVFCDAINNAIGRGVRIINHGIIPFEKVSQLYCQCKATVYPSTNESLGLGMIESLEAGCDVIAPDLPYVWSVCHPSETFSKGRIDTMVEAVIKYEEGFSERSVLTINDKIDELIDLLR